MFILSQIRVVGELSVPLLLAYSKNKSSSSTLSANGRYLGLTNLDIFQYAKSLYEIGAKISMVNLLKLDYRMPKTFSKNRFGGDHKNFYKSIEEQTELVYNPYYRDETQRKLAKQLLEQNRRKKC